jgi:oxygen-independent coproporphyrinogen-3 oxidase
MARPALNGDETHVGSPTPRLENWQRAGFGLYVHWPFCAAKCPYCDFNSHVSARVDADAWLRAMLLELDRVARDSRGRILSTVFFGGGTPSLMPPEIVGGILERAAQRWTFSNDVEVTLEANPTSVESRKMTEFRAAGVNRISLGLQALDDEALRLLGRRHSAAEGRAALDIAAKTFDRTSIDLIYARQHQSVQAWNAELSTALNLPTEHVSLYQLTIEPGTIFARRHRAGRLPGLPDDDYGADLFEMTQALCEAVDRPAYEVSNHAAPGAECRHNLIYWRGGDWAAIGPGSHGRMTVDGVRTSTVAVSAPSEWLDLVILGKSPLMEDTRQSTEERADEYVMTALRLTEGVDLNYLAELGMKIETKGLDAEGFVILEGSRLRSTRKGRLLLDAVLERLSLRTIREEFA